MRRVLVRVGAFLGRTTSYLWLSLGAVLAVWALVEGTYRGATSLAARKRARAVDSTAHPYASESWWPRFQGKAGLASRVNRFDPYRGHWARPTKSEFVSVDSLGRRVVAQPASWHAAPTKVFLLGASTMWGVTARDSFDIPSLTAAALRELGAGPVEVVDLAQMAFNSTQELNTLVVELAHHRVPVVAVFLDGYNDIATAWKYGEPGHSYGDDGIDQQIQRGTRGFWATLGGLGWRSTALNRLGKMLGVVTPPPPVRGGPTEICGPVAAYYRRIATMAEDIGEAEGFRVGYFLQPVHTATKKRLTPWERGLPRPRSLAACMSSIDSAMADRRGTAFFSLVDLFDSDTETVFVDQNAHVTEAANRKVAARIAATIAPWLHDAALASAHYSLPVR